MVAFAYTVISAASCAMAFTGRVVAVSDGDTITVLHAETNQAVKVRLYGIDAPEKNQNFGAQSARLTKELVMHEDVTVEEFDIDRYGRTVGIVTVANTTVNEKLVENGLAMIYPQYCKITKCDSWAKKQGAARVKKVGIWQDEDIIPPWDFRKQSRK